MGWLTPNLSGRGHPTSRGGGTHSGWFRQADLMVLGPDPDAEAIGNALRSAAERADAVGAW